ncbi:ribonuclease VapC [Roseiarcus fermentans]|uniref:Ribonuclease VapC n=2 Tax=Roseiarcus fermentans TaxID=1473586 RepID=A0A366FS26_9HYPH|nr:ribonuclease VapC [Roseiarcus fermentans]
MVETSALVAIVLEEPGWEPLAELVVSAKAFTTCINVFEASLALVRELTASPKAAHEIVLGMASRLNIAITDYPAGAVAFAASARQEFGRGRHGLNMGDCLSYGAARLSGARLLYVGEDFARTDVND